MALINKIMDSIKATRGKANQLKIKFDRNAHVRKKVKGYTYLNKKKIPPKIIQLLLFLPKNEGRQMKC